MFFINICQWLDSNRRTLMLGSDRSSNWATSIAPLLVLFICKLRELNLTSFIECEWSFQDWFSLSFEKGKFQHLYKFCRTQNFRDLNRSRHFHHFLLDSFVGQHRVCERLWDHPTPVKRGNTQARAWSSLVEGDDGCIGPSRVLYFSAG